jgi:hypothetical protein
MRTPHRASRIVARWGRLSPSRLGPALTVTPTITTGTLHRLPEAVADLRRRAADASDEATRAQARLGTPWEHAGELTRLRRRQQELDDALTQTDTPSPDTAGPEPTGTPAASLQRLRQRLDRPSPPTAPGGISL